MENKIKIRITLWLALCAIIFWLIYMGIAPFGKIEYAYDFTKPNYFISKLSPNERLSQDNGKINNLILADPVYFNLRTPRRFEKAELEIKYKNPADASIIEVGVLADKKIWRYDLKPLENRLLEQLTLVWDLKQDNNLLLFSNPEHSLSASGTKYENVAQFLNSPPPINQIAQYNYELKTDFYIPDYRPFDSLKDLAIPEITGAYQLYVYLKDEDFDFEFDFVDQNQNSDPDEIDLRLYFDNQLLDFRHLADDGIISDNNEKSAMRSLEFKLSGLPEGAYKLEIKANSDIITKNIRTKQTKIAFISKIDLHAAGNADIEIFTNSRRAQFTTIHPASLQKIKINDHELDINETYRQFKQEIETSTNTARILLERDGIAVSGDALFSFSESAFFNPKIKKADKYLDAASAGINYVISDYSFPRQDKGWKYKTIDFDLSSAYREKNTYSFIISVPDLASEDSKGVLIDEIKIKLSGKSLWKKISEVLKK